MPSKYLNKKIFAFTTYGTGYLRALVNEVGVSEAFDPNAISTGPLPQETRCQAIWDTGATNTCITRRIAAQLGLEPSGRAIVSGVHGSKEVSTYFINLYLPNNVTILGISATEAEIGGDVDVLIGMDVIRHGDLSVCNFNSRTIFSFRVPSVEEIDFKKEIDQANRESAPQTTDSLRKERNRKKQAKRKRTKKSGKR